MVPALKTRMQQTCLYYRGRELQAQRRDDQQTHIWKGCSNCTAVYSFFNVLCLIHDCALNIVIMILKKKLHLHISYQGWCRGQKTTYRNRFSPYTMWVRGIQVSHPCLMAAAFTRWESSQATALGKSNSLQISVSQKPLSPHIEYVSQKS